MDISLRDIKGIGKTRLQALEAAGIRTVRQLVMQFPAEYRDLTQITELENVPIGTDCAVHVAVAGSVSVKYVKKLSIIKCYVTDSTQVLPVVWFNQPWLKNSLEKGKELILFGRFEMRGGTPTMVSPSIEHETGMIPVYRSLAGIPARSVRAVMKDALAAMDGQWPDELPERIRREYGLCERNFAMRAAHEPQDRQALEKARYRLAFEELLLYQTGLFLMRDRAKAGVCIPVTDGQSRTFFDSLPYTPTDAQRNVCAEIARDMASKSAMARLVQGDVGSGKTMVAFYALYCAAKNGFQAALMAPTEILAQQHFESAGKLLEPLGVRCALLTGSMTPKQHASVTEKLAAGEIDVLIGTHALISENVIYKDLGLVVTDEQHRFGVAQRTTLSQKGDNPNVLVMSATPIPRTMALILYGDLDLSVIDRMPPGRIPVTTKIVPEAKRAAMYGFIMEEIRNGRQAYVVCSLVEDSETVDALSAEQVYEELKEKLIPQARIGLVHGHMKSADKDAVLNAFHAGEIDVLVSTTVIEVGVNVPNAVVMVVENAERFGLAQLHQLRGRVGRGTERSWCFLLGEANERLRLLAQTNDGFVIAQKDMELRGIGDLMGKRQSGMLSLGTGAAAGDGRLLKCTHDLARRLIGEPESDEAKQIFRLAEEAMRERFEDVGVN